MIKNLGAILFSSILGFSSCTPVDPALKESILKGATLIDVRTEKEFAGGSARGAINIPLDQVESRIAEFKKEKEIVVFCRSGNRSGQAKTILNKHGINSVLNGGAWGNVKKIQEENEN